MQLLRHPSNANRRVIRLLRHFVAFGSRLLLRFVESHDDFLVLVAAGNDGDKSASSPDGTVIPPCWLQRTR